MTTPHMIAIGIEGGKGPASALADAYRHAWRAAASSAARLQKAVAALAALRGRCVERLVAALGEVAPQPGVRPQTSG